MIRYNDVKHISTEEYFKNNQFSIDAFNKKYAQIINGKLETYPQALKRVCDFIASVEETPELQAYWSERWFDEIWEDWWHPAGSIMQGADSKKSISLSNCTTISLGTNRPEEEWDNLESIYKNTAYTVAKTAAFRQGLGVDFSRLRPRSAKVLNSANESTGAIHWMREIDGIGYQVGQRGRIPAMLFSLNVKHPDVIEFIKAKSDTTFIQNANISVQCTDDFYMAVYADADWEMRFEVPAQKSGDKIYIDAHSIDMNTNVEYDIYGNKRYFKYALNSREAEVIVKTEKARTILELIAKGMFTYAEPGIQNIDMARKWSNSDYVYNPADIYDSRIVSSNACSEQYLSRESLCVLASINSGKFSILPELYEQELSKIAPSVNRFLDNVNEAELRFKTFATPHQELAIQKLRRTGAGSTNWAAWFFKQKLDYASPESIQKAKAFNRCYNYYLYKSSIELGAEKGNFGLFDKDKYIQSPFIQHMMEQGLEFDTMRNVTCSSIAPTGTLSLMFRDLVMSYGVEPGFGIYYWKRTRISGKYEYYFNVPAVVREVFKNAGYEIPMSSDTLKDTWDGSVGRPIAEFIEKHKEAVGIVFKQATEIDPLHKLEFMSHLMKDCDSSISVTYLLPESSSWQEVYNFILRAYEKGVKSIAAYPDRKMYGIVSFMPFKDLAKKLIVENVDIHPQNFSESELAELNLTKTTATPSASANKREKTLPADVYTITVKGEKFIIAVGLQGNAPYEVFGGKITSELDKYSFHHKPGHITKVTKGQYKLEFEQEVIESLSQHFTPIEQMFFRLISTSLRHGTPIKFLIEQMNKSVEDITSLASAVARVLKKYIKNGEIATGMECPSCKSRSLIYIDGCASCSNCSWSKCN